MKIPKLFMPVIIVLLFILLGAAATLARSWTSTLDKYEAKLQESDKAFWEAHDLSCLNLAETQMKCARKVKGTCSKYVSFAAVHREKFNEDPSTGCLIEDEEPEVEETVAPIANDNPDAPINPIFFGDEE